jgi:hypothetical protein
VTDDLPNPLELPQGRMERHGELKDGVAWAHGLGKTDNAMRTFQGYFTSQSK